MFYNVKKKCTSNTVPTVQKLLSNEPSNRRETQERQSSLCIGNGCTEKRIIQEHRLRDRSAKSEEQREARWLRCRASLIDSDSDVQQDKDAMIEDDVQESREAKLTIMSARPS